MKGNKGITLIALVITIIVLLILAGVSIAMLSGENGILNQASKSSVYNQIGAAKDACALIASEELSSYMESVYVNNSGAYSSTTLDTQIKTAISTNTVATTGISVSWGESDYKLTLTHTDGTYVTGTLSNGKITWDSITDPS